MVDNELQQLAQEVGQALIAKKLMLSFAESCTGGLASVIITNIPGSSAWFDGGVVTYSNQAKSEDLDVSPHLIEVHGAVSDPVARAMALGAKQNSSSQVALSITGIAGPTGGSTEKPVGTVCFAWILANDKMYSETKLFQGNRQRIREQACEFTLKRLMELVINQ